MIRKLTIADEALIRGAYGWREAFPRWFQVMLSEGGPGNEWDEYWAISQRCIEFGVFDDTEMFGLISLEPQGPSRMAAHISAKRGSNAEALAYAAFVVRDWLFKQGIKEIFAWVAARHPSLKKLCVLSGLKPDTLTMIKGVDRGRLIHWERYSAVLI